MKHYVIVNNYQLGAIVRKTPTHKIISQERLDRNHTKVVYQDLTIDELRLTNKWFNGKVNIVEECQ